MAHGDYTGQLKSQLAAKHAKEQELRAKELSLVTQVVAEQNQETVDLIPDKPDSPTMVDPDTGEPQVIEVDYEDPQFQPVVFRSRETIEAVTVGRDNHYNLEAGRNYRAPRWVVEHLDRQNLVYH